MHSRNSASLRSPSCWLIRTVVAACVLTTLTHALGVDALAQDAHRHVVLAREGKPALPIVAGSVDEPVVELRRYLARIVGGEFKSADAKGRPAGIYVGLLSDFPWVKVDQQDKLGPEGFVLRSDGRSVYLLAANPLGVQHAVTTFLHRLGCRWFFPGKAWEVVQRQPTVEGRWDERHTPAFRTQRRIWYGYGAYASGKRDLSAWERHNRMGGPTPVIIGHTWHGLKPDKEFTQHPEWFALVGGKRQPSKPCYSHPQVVQRAIDTALSQAARRPGMISMTPPDGLGYCECERCLKVFKGGKPYRAHGSLFAKRPDGELVNITSDTLFTFINAVAKAVAERHPDTLIGCYAYSAYSHPPSFRLHPNVYLQTTTAYRRTPISLDEQLRAFGQRTTQVGIREYYSVYQWDWDYPNAGKLTPAQLADDLRRFHTHGVTAVNAEASNNWAARGLGYYVASQLMWDVNVDTRAVVTDFYQRAFGPAAVSMQSYYVRWYGPSAAALEVNVDLPQRQTLCEMGKFNVAALKASYIDLNNAIAVTPADSAYRQRIDLLRMYVHYLFLRYLLHQAEQSGDARQIIDAIKAETVFGARLTDTHMIHTRPLIGKAFLRRFRKHEALLTDVADAQRSGRGWRQIGQPPDAAELERLWSQDLRALGIR